MKTPKAYFVNALSHEQAFSKALQFALKRAIDTKKDVALLVHTKANLDGVIADVLGPPFCDALRKTGSVDVAPVRVHLVTQRVKPTHFSGPVVAAWAEEDLLDVAMTLNGATDVIAVPWGPNEPGLVNWKAAHQAEDIESGQPSAKVAIDPVVEHGLEDLRTLVNESTGVSHPSDRALAIEILGRLREAGFSFAPEAIRAWLVGKGWHPNPADAVKDIAEGVLTGRRFKDAARVLRGDIVEGWKAS